MAEKDENGVYMDLTCRPRPIPTSGCLKQPIESESQLSSSKLKDKNEELQKQVLDLQQTIENERERCKSDREKHQRKIEDVEREKRELNNQLSVSRIENDKLRDHIQALELKLEDAKQTQKDSIGENKKLHKRVQELELKLEGEKHRQRDNIDDDLSLPDDWETMPDYRNCMMFPAPPSHLEMVQRRFFESLGRYKANIIKIARVQNKCLYLQYKLKKIQIEQEGRASNEKFLWHGTFGEAVSGITVNGFDRGFQGFNGTKFGKGVYFSTTSEYSVSYSQDDRHKEKHMFLARVLTGDFTLGKQVYSVLPIKDHSSFTRYDSLVNDVNSPTIYVVMNDTQAYPEYLVTYEITGAD